MKHVVTGLLTLISLMALGQKAWLGNGADNLWSNPGNWADNSPPPDPYTGTLYFGNPGMGTNVLDADRQVRYLVYTNNSLEASHTLDLGGKRLTVEEYLQSWLFDKNRTYTNSNTHVVITNGAIQLGTATRDADLRATYCSSITPNYYLTTNNTLVISADLLATNWGSLSVCHHTSSFYMDSILEGSMDLSRSTIVSEGVSNRIKCATLAVGHAANDTNCRGLLRLPPTIYEIDTDDFLICGSGRGYGWGIFNLGENSQLKRIIARNNFWYGGGGNAIITNWPGSVDLVLGTPTSPASFRVGSGNSTQKANIGSVLINSNAVVEGYISDFMVGTSLRYNYGRAVTGIVDLATCAIHTGGHSNELHTTSLQVGGTYIATGTEAFGGRPALLKLPPTLTKIVTGLFQLSAIDRGPAYLDFGPNSQLKTLTVTNDFYYGHNGGRAYLVNFPTSGVTLSIGTPERPAIYSQGSTHCRTYTYVGQADLILTNVIWSAQLANADIGMSRWSALHDYYTSAKLDLRASTLAAFEVADSMVMGHGYNSPQYQTHKYASAQVYLPVGQVNIATNLVLGDTKAPYRTLLDLNGTTVTVGRQVELWPTATINARVQGRASGLEITSTAADALSVSNGAVINVIFEQDPSDIEQRRYSGLAVAGDQVAHLQELNSAGQLLWDTTALSERWAKKVGIHYHMGDDVTYVGFDPRTQGTLLLLR